MHAVSREESKDGNKWIRLVFQSLTVRSSRKILKLYSRLKKDFFAVHGIFDILVAVNFFEPHRQFTD